MTPKYKFTGEKDDVLNRIVALRDFGDVKAGDVGGWIEKEENLSHYSRRRKGERIRLDSVQLNIKPSLEKIDQYKGEDDEK